MVCPDTWKALAIAGITAALSFGLTFGVLYLVVHSAGPHGFASTDSKGEPIELGADFHTPIIMFDTSLSTPIFFVVLCLIGFGAHGILSKRLSWPAVVTVLIVLGGVYVGSSLAANLARAFWGPNWH